MAGENSATVYVSMFLGLLPRLLGQHLYGLILFFTVFELILCVIWYYLLKGWLMAVMVGNVVAAVHNGIHCKE